MKQEILIKNSGRVRDVVNGTRRVPLRRVQPTRAASCASCPRTPRQTDRPTTHGGFRDRHTPWRASRWAFRSRERSASAEERTPALKDRWDLAAIFPTTEAFDAAKKAFVAKLPELEKNQGKLGASPATMKPALDAYFGAQKDLARLCSYASMQSDEDTRVAATLGARQEVQQLANDFAARTSWIAPEVLALPAGTVDDSSRPSRVWLPTASSWRISSASGRTP